MRDQNRQSLFLFVVVLTGYLLTLFVLWYYGAELMLPPRPSLPKPPKFLFYETGIASWYGPRFDGRKTANKEIFDAAKISTAHPSLPFGTIVLVRNLKTGKSLMMRVNDRGPFEGVVGKDFYRGRRVIDVSQAAARELGFERQGLARVEILTPTEWQK